ncbi:MAG: hypothetical protein ABR543_16060 [Gemmatimonadaceae bacterium]
MSVMRYFAICCCVAVLLGCAKTGDDAATDTAAGAAAMPDPAAPAALSLADVAGKWQMHSTPVAGTDTTTTRYVLIATADTSGWTRAQENLPIVPVRVTVSGDSIMTDAGPFQSVRRKGLQVRTQSVLRLEGGKLVGTSVAHYKTTGPDSVLRLRVEGTRIP